MTRSQSSQPPRSSSPAAARKIHLAAVTAIGQAAVKNDPESIKSAAAIQLTSDSAKDAV